MQDISNVNEESISLMPAQDLREVTATPEAIFNRQKNEVLQSLMTSMVQFATTNGVYEYSAQLHPNFDEKMLSEIKETLENLGYGTSSNEGESQAIGKHIVLNVSWKAEEDVSN